MNSTQLDPKRRRWASLVLVCAIALLLIVSLVAFTGCARFRLSRDAATLRDCFIKPASVDSQRKIEFGIGPLSFHLARAGLSWVDLNPEVRSALGLIRSAEVGVYRLPAPRKEKGVCRSSALPVLDQADSAMADRGWERIVGVVNARESVGIYVPKQTRSERNVKVCLAVCNRDELIVASVRTNLEPLLDLASKHLDEKW